MTPLSFCPLVLFLFLCLTFLSLWSGGGGGGVAECECVYSFADKLVSFLLHFLSVPLSVDKHTTPVGLVLDALCDVFDTRLHENRLSFCLVPRAGRASRRDCCWNRPAPSRGGRNATSSSEAELSTTPKTPRWVDPVFPRAPHPLVSCDVLQS